MKGFLGTIGAGLAIWLLLNLLVAGNLFHFRFWAPQYRDAQREVFQQSQSYVQGKITHITRLQIQYESAEEGPTKEAYRNQIRSEAATVDLDDLPEHLQEFIAEISNGDGS